MSAESPRHMRSGGPLTVPAQPPPDRSIIDAVSGFINDVKLTSPTVDPKDVIQWARFETADINEPTSEGDSDTDISPLLLILGYGTGVQVWLIPPTGEAQEVLSWRQGTVRVLRILPSPNRGDCFTSKRPLIALCDSVSPGPSFCSLSFISIRGGEQVKSIKFKNPILDVLANKRSVVVSFSERFAVFDAATLEDRMAVTTCYPCPCPLGGSTPINPLALGERWLAYADKKLNPSKRSSGGCESEGQTSYTATVLHAAKSLGKGLRGLGESVAQSLAGTRAASQSPSPPHSDVMQPGVITVLDIEGIEEEDGQDAEDPCDPIVAHFVAHSEAVTALTFDASGLILVTADRRGHDFHVFRLNPHPCGPALAAVHHLYVLHRGDTTAKVQDISISCDCRWAAVSTLRGTTHVFAVAPYGGAAGVRTHTQARVVNRLSRFHRSAGLPIHCANKPASPVGEGAGAWFPNPRLPPYPQPALCSPLAQLRPTANLATHTITRTSSGRQRLSSLSEESGVGAAPLLARAAWGPAGAAGPGGTGPGARAGSHALYLMTAAGNLLHLLVHPRPANSVPKEKISDESPIEVEVEAVAQWALQRPAAAADLIAPLPPSNPLLQPAHCARCPDMCMSEEERWLAQVEIVTHAGPHRRLWMGPQFVFKTYNLTGSNSSLSEAEAVEVESVARSNPVNMPAAVPVLVDSGSASSLEQSPSDSFRRKSLVCEPRATSVCDVRLREDLAEAMKEDHGSCEAEAGPVCARGVARAVGPAGTVVRAAPNPAPARSDPDAYTRANADEATFRPVLNAPASLPPPALPASPLPATTTIPVQSVASDDLYALRPYTPPDDVYDSGDSVADVGRIQPVEALDAAKGRADETKMRVSASEEMLMELTSAAMESNHDSDIKPLKLEKQSQKEQLEAVVPPPKKISNVESVPEIKIVDAKVGKDKKSNSRSAKSYDSPVTKVKETKKEISESVKEIPEIKKEGSVKLDVSEPKKSEVKGAKKELSESLKEIPEFKKEGSVRRGVSDTKKQVKETKKDSCDKKRDAIEIKIAPSEQNEVSESKKSAAAIKKEFRESKIEVFTEQIAAKKEASESKKEATIKKVVAETKPVTSLVTEALKEVERKKYIEKDSLETSISNKVTTGFKKSPEKDILQLDKNELLEKKDSAEFKSKKDKSAMKSMNFSPESKQPQKNNSERESSLKRETADLKSSWKRESKLDWSIKSDSNEKPTVSKELDVIKAPEEQHVVEIKTEDQAWDMLLNEPEKSVSTLNPQTVATDKTDESKSKSKKNRKLKKSLDEAQSKSEDDSFVEIHAIEDKIQPSSGELVSISMPYEEIESSSSYSSKTKKSRSPKNSTDKKQQPKLDDWSIEDIGCDNKTTTCKKKSISSEIDILLGYDSESIQKVDTDCIKLEGFESIATDSSTKDKKTKAFVSNQETYISYEKSLEVDVKDVYVIDSTKEEFPEIQITSVRGNKMRKKSPQLEIIKKTEDKEIVSEIPIKSWSAIAASKNTKKTDEPDKVRPTEPINIEKKLEYKEKDIKNESKVGKKSKPSRYDVDDEPSSPLSLHEELMRLCKRTDIMVAECDAPSELNFVEEHHSLLQDLPPLDLDFGMDDFNLEVMRDSLLEVNDTKISSPICKIDIDSILSSIKESTSAFNLIDLEKVPDKKEKGFSVVENDKIRSEEVIADDDKSDEKEIEAMEKSSDDDNTSPASADSEKDENKTGASNLTLPSTKQSSKSKKSRRKKK